MPITIDGKLTYGLALDGVFHKDFTMRVPTLEEVETALEDAGPDASSARVARCKWGQCITRLGSIPPEKINAELLAKLPAYDFAALEAAEGDLIKKLASASADPSTPSA